MAEIKSLTAVRGAQAEADSLFLSLTEPGLIPATHHIRLEGTTDESNTPNKSSGKSQGCDRAFYHILKTFRMRTIYLLALSPVFCILVGKDERNTV